MPLVAGPLVSISVHFVWLRRNQIHFAAPLLCNLDSCWTKASVKKVGFVGKNYSDMLKSAKCYGFCIFSSIAF